MGESEISATEDCIRTTAQEHLALQKRFDCLFQRSLQGQRVDYFSEVLPIIERQINLQRAQRRCHFMNTIPSKR